MFGGMLVMAYYGSHITIAFLDAGTFASIGIAALNVVFTFAITMVGALFLKRCVFKKFVGRVPLWSLKHIGWLIYQAINATLGMTVLQYVIGATTALTLRILLTLTCIHGCWVSLRPSQ